MTVSGATFKIASQPTYSPRGNHAAQSVIGFFPESFEQMRLKIAHVLKHSGTMLGDNVRVVNCRQTDMKFVSYFCAHVL
jgi:hypothetical protein